LDFDPPVGGRISDFNMKVVTFILGELQTNCYLVFDEDSKEGVIIDPADDANYLSEQILRLKINLKSLMATHGHFDHTLAAYELQMAFKIPFFVHRADLFLVKNLQKNAAFWTNRIIVEKSPEKINFFKEGGGIKVGKEDLRAIETPGHTPGGVCLHGFKNKILFTGDTLFANGVGRTDLSYSSKKDLLSSLKKLSQLPPETKIYPGHEDPSTLKEALNSQLRL
jgi:glyoxylase-like metal-dependent hydrolase (beta-lactamase superfamily II)